MSTWNLDKVEKGLNDAFDKDSEIDLLEIIKENSFLLSPLYDRKGGALPSFSEVAFGGVMRCDFAWLEDSSDGPEWVLVEIEKPKMKLFTKNGEGDPASELNHAIEQVRSWDRYFQENPGEKRRIFGAVARFRYLLVGGTREDWQKEKASKWRIQYNSDNKIEIRSCDVFYDALNIARKHFGELWSFEENPQCLKHSDLKPFWQNYGYMDRWRQILS